MPDPPPVGLFTRYVLENPYPAGLLMLALAVGLAWTALRTDGRRNLAGAGVLAALGALVLLVGAVVVTPGEAARRVVLAVVKAAEAAEIAEASAHFSDEATLAFGSPNNPGYPREAIERNLDRLGDRYRITSNQITSLKAFSESPRQATVHLGLRTTLEVGFGPTPTWWVLRVEQEPDGTWRITRATWVSIAGSTPSPRVGG